MTIYWIMLDPGIRPFVATLKAPKVETCQSLTTIINLIGATTTGAGLKVFCDRDTNDYPTGIRISKSEIDALDIRRAEFHGDWNYTLLPNPDNVSVSP